MRQYAIFDINAEISAFGEVIAKSDTIAAKARNNDFIDTSVTEALFELQKIKCKEPAET